MMVKLKKLFFFTLIFICFLFVNIIYPVYAAEGHTLSKDNVTIECIYSDGGLYTASYVGKAKSGELETSKFTVNRTAYNIDGVDNNSSNSGSASRIINYPHLDEFRCQNTMYHARIKFSSGNEDNNDEEDTPVDYYKFATPITCDDTAAGENFWSWYYGNSAYKCIGVEVKDSGKHKLLSERIHMQYTAPHPVSEVYYVKRATQAAGTDVYVTVMVYDNVVLLKNGDRITYLEGGDIFKGVVRNEEDNTLNKDVPEHIWLNEPEPQVTTNSASNISYRFLDGQISYSLSQAKDSTHTQEFELTDEIVDGNGGSNDELCTKILPETSKVLKNVIKWSQIMVPILLIVLTGVDIGKIVVSGNIDEELPKRKKVITIRFIVAVVFFFLPLFIRVMTNWLTTSGANYSDNIKYIDCLFK